MNQPIVVKSYPNGINLILDKEVPFPQILEATKSKFANAEKFFKGARLSLTFEGRDLTEEEKQQILDTITQNSTIDIVCILEHDDIKEQAMKELIDQKEQDVLIETSNDDGAFYKGTIRSGQEVSFESSIVIVGDVHPGATVISTGNVVVLGTLKGTVIAGKSGDRKSFVAALSMDPVQIQICNVLARSMDRDNLARIQSKNYDPQIATIYENSILIEPISQSVLKQI